MDPRGKIAVVTGAAGGIGGALVRALVAAGATTVVATEIRTDALPSDHHRVPRPPALRPHPLPSDDHVVPRPLDVADAAATQALVESVEAEFGPIDLWFANA